MQVKLLHHVIKPDTYIPGMQKWNCFNNQKFNVRKQKIHKDWRNQLWAEDDEEPQPGENTKYILLFIVIMLVPRIFLLTVFNINVTNAKHIEIDTHFVCEIVASGQARVLHVPSHFSILLRDSQVPTALFLEVRSSLNVRIPSAPTAGLSSHYITIA